MKVRVKHTRVIDGVSYRPGVVDMPDELSDHWYAKSLFKSGDFTLDGTKAEEPADKELPKWLKDEKVVQGKNAKKKTAPALSSGAS